MLFKQYKDGSCDILFSKEEAKIIHKDKKIHLSELSLRHFGNYLIKIVADWQTNFNEETKKTFTYEDTPIIGTKSKKDIQHIK